VPLSDNNLAGLPSPQSNVWAANNTLTPYSNAAPDQVMDPAAMGSSGGSQPHDNMIPFLVINFILSLFGIFPSQT
jgi:microcystin-dependent protein